MLFDHPEVVPIALGQAGVATTLQLLKAGVSSQMLRRARERGEVVEVQPGVLASSWTPWTLELAEFAAVLAAGYDAALSSLSALHRYGARPAPERVHICVGHRRRPRLDDVVVHRSRIWQPLDTRVVGGLCVTNPVRTSFDAAEILRPRSLRGTLEKLVIDEIVTWDELVAAWKRMYGRHGLKRIRPILDSMHHDLASFDSKLEVDFLHLVEEASLPLPDHHVVLDTGRRGYEVDFVWRWRPLVVEVDGPHHLIPEQRRYDSRRDNALELAGWPVQRFLHTEIRGDPEYVISVLRSRLKDVGT